MVAHSKYLVTCNKNLASKQFCARYSDIYRDISRSKNRYLYYSPPPTLYFRKCNTARCKTCPQASNSQIISDPLLHPFCKAFNVIYRITCTVCNLKYIGETSTPLHLRINQHRSDSCNFSSSTNCKSTVELQHFNLHNFKNTSIEILKICKLKNERLFLESSYMQYFNTLYPYGLNTECFNRSLKVFSNISNINDYSPLYPNLNHSLYVKTKRTKRGKSSHSYTISRNIIIKQLNSLYQNYNIDYNWLSIRKFIFAIKKKYLKLYLNVFLAKKFDSHFCDIFYDLIMSKIQQFNLDSRKKSKNSSSNTQMVITFSNQVFNKFNFTSLLNDPSCAFPIKGLRVSRTFKYPISLGRKIFNYNSFAKNSHSSNLLPCKCNLPSLQPFIDKNHGHIVTGNLNIVDDYLLRKFMCYGTKFRLPSKSTYKQIIAQFTYDIDLFIYKISVSYNKPIAFFDEWKHLVIMKLHSYLQLHASNIVSYNHKLLLQQISKLKNNFVITYVDKAANNYAIICKLYYHQLLNSVITSNSNFIKVNTNIIINNRSILNYYKLLDIPHTNFKYPYLVLIPKFHKTPIKFRTVTIGCNTYNNNANKLLLSILTQLHNITSQSHNTHYLKNSFQLIDILKGLKNVNNIITLDFKDLFNNIYLSDLSDIINSMFCLYQNQLTLPDKVDANYFKTLTNFIIFKNYLLQNDTIYLQKVGIPQGGCTSSILADLYLYHYESNFMNNDILLYRYIDDIILLYTNDCKIYDLPVKYPRNLELTKNLLSNNTISFLDLHIYLNDSKIDTNIYDKRSDFNFRVNLFTHFNSCLHISIYRNIILNHLFRIKNLCSSQYKNKNINKLIHAAINSGYPKKFIYSLVH